MTNPRAGRVAGQPRSRRRHAGRLLRRIGGVAVTMALVALGLAGGLWLGSPSASAATGDIRVDMGDGSGFVPGTAQRLLQVAELTPGGSVSGTMQVKDTSGVAAGSGQTDTVVLSMVDVATADSHDGGQVNAGSGDALRGALEFTVTVTGAGAIPPHGTLTVSDLVGGITLARGLADQDVVAVTMAASLPVAVGNDVQYGSLSFNLGLSLETAADEGSQQGGNPGDGTGGGGGDDAGEDGLESNNLEGSNGADDGQGLAGSDSDIGVLGESDEVAGSNNQGDSDILVLGDSQSVGDGALGYTGAPIRILSLAGAAILAVGLILLLVARRRTRLYMGAHDGG